MKLAKVNASTVHQLWTRTSPLVQAAGTLEVAAQCLTSAVYDSFDESAVLVRTFVTVPYEELAIAERDFADSIVAAKGAEAPVAATPVLTLVGSRGVLPEWNDRRASSGHVAIPLTSSELVGEIPMLMQLLEALGVPFRWFDAPDAVIVDECLGPTGGLFYVADAVSAVDGRGRRIIGADEFVRAQRVRSVFGVGGTYFGAKHVLVLIVFSRDEVTRTAAGSFLGLPHFFKAATTRLVARGRIFQDSGQPRELAS